MLFEAKLDDHGVAITTKNCTVPEMLTAIYVITNSLYERLDGANKHAFKESFLMAARDELPFLSEAARHEKAKEIEKEAVEKKMKDLETSDDDDDETFEMAKKFLKGLKGLLDDD